MIIAEELKAKNGPAGARYGTVVDKETNEPIASYTKSNYSRNYDVAWHPTFLSLNPGMKNSIEAESHFKFSGHKDSPDSLQSVVGAVERAHGAMAANGFRDRHDVKATKMSETQSRYDYHDRDTGDHLATRVINHGTFRDSPANTGFSTDFIAKHNIPEDVASAAATRLHSLPGHLFPAALDREIKELSTKKELTGLHAHGNAVCKVFQIGSDPATASSTYENHLRGSGFSVNRLSDQHFHAVSGDGTESVHSMVVGDKLHAIHTRIAGYSAKPHTNSLNI